MTPEDCTRAIDQPMQDVGAAFYFDAQTVDNGKEHVGLDGFRFYVVGRGGVLGDVPTDIVRSAFGYFEPALVEKMWTTGRERMTVASVRDVAQLYLECAHRFGATRFADLDLEGFNEAVATVVASVDVAALPLFAGYRSMPTPSAGAELATHNAVLLRELRGSIHLAAVVAAGLDSAVAHVIRRPDDIGLFGLTDTAPEVTDIDRHALAEADRNTDAVMAKALSVLDDGDRDALATTANAMAERI